MNKDQLRSKVFYGLSVIIPVLLQVSYIRYASYGISSEHYGKFIFAQSLIAAISLVLNQVVTQSYTRFYHQSKNSNKFKSEFQFILLILNVLSSAVMVVVGFLFNLGNNLILLSIFYIIFQNNFSLNAQKIILDQKSGNILINKVYESAARFLFPLLFYAYFATVESLIFGVVFGYFISNTFRKNFEFKVKINDVKLSAIKKYLKFSYPMLFVSVFSWGITFSDRIFIKEILGYEVLAGYGLMTQVASLGMLISQYYSIAVIPKLYRSYSIDENRTYMLFKQQLLVLTMLLIGIVAFSITFIPETIWAFFINPIILFSDNNFLIFTILVFSTSFCIIQNFLGVYFSLTNQLSRLSLIYTFAFFLNLAGNFTILLFGIMGAAVATALAWLSIVLLQLRHIRKCQYS